MVVTWMINSKNIILHEMGLKLIETKVLWTINEDIDFEILLFTNFYREFHMENDENEVF